MQRFVSDSRGLHEALVVKARKILQSPEKVQITRGTEGDAAPIILTALEHPKPVGQERAVAGAENLDSLKILPTHLFNDAVGPVAGDFGFCHVDDKATLGIKTWAWTAGREGFGEGAISELR